jgi:uncharacterized protein DUF1524
MSPKAEPVVFSEQPTIEHILPQGWRDHWPLPDGLKSLDFLELTTATERDPNAIATRKREQSLQTIGNLTILSAALNSAQSNSAWNDKRSAMAKHSLLPINQDLLRLERWNEAEIHKRALSLFERALVIWPR